MKNILKAGIAVILTLMLACTQTQQTDKSCCEETFGYVGGWFG